MRGGPVSTTVSTRVKPILQFLDRERWWPLWAMLVGALVPLPGLGASGFWEPHEIQVADSAMERYGQTPEEKEEEEEEDGEQGAKKDNAGQASRTGQSKKPDNKTAVQKEPDGPPLTQWSIARGVEFFTDHRDLGARLPLALLGLIALVAAFFLGQRMASPRAGLLTALVLVTFPLFLLQSRQLMSDIGAVTGSALIVLGLVGVAWPTEGRPVWLYVVDALLIAVGACLSYLAAAALLGIFVPFAAFAVAAVAALIGQLPATCAPRPAEAEALPGKVPSQYPLLPGTRTSHIVALAIVTLGAVAVYRESLTLAVVTALALLVAVAVVIAVAIARSDGSPAVQRSMVIRVRRRLWIVAVTTGAVALASLAYILGQVFELSDPVPGERALFGYSVLPVDRYVEVIGGTWKLRDDLDETFDSLFEHIAYGAFPWVVLAPIALAHLAMARRRGRKAWSGFVLFSWATVTWVVSAITARKVGAMSYPALVAIAAGIGLWLDDLLDARDQADATKDSDIEARSGFGLTLRLPLVALFAGLAVLVLGKDIQSFPDKFLSLAAEGPNIQYPEGTLLLKAELKYWPMGFGVLFAFGLSCGLLLWRRCKKHGELATLLYWTGRHGVRAAVVSALLFALFMAHAWLPILGQKLSSKHVFRVYHELRSDGDELGIMGNHGSGPTYYAGSEWSRIASRNQLVEFLGKDRRIFALTPATELCSIHRTVKGEIPYFVLDDSNAKFLLLSNQHKEGEKNINPLARTMLREEPPELRGEISDGRQIVRPAVNFDDRIELVAVEMPDQVDRGDTFEVTLFFKVLRPVGGAWKIFLHFDGGRLRFQGDHDPVETVRCSTAFWQTGDYIVDTVEVTAGNITFAKTHYNLHVGLFRGSGGNWTNMKITTAGVPKDSVNRAQVGRIRVD